MDDKAKYHLEYYKKNRDKILKQSRKRYREDTEFRQRVKKYYREKYHKDVVYHERTKTLARNRYHTDSDYRKKTIERVKRIRKLIKNKRGNKNG
jgi:hypothetical protein